MINPHNDSAFYAYADWAAAQEIAWDEAQQELEEEEEELEAPKGLNHWNQVTNNDNLSPFQKVQQQETRRPASFNN